MKPPTFFPEVGQPDTTPMSGKIMWEHPRVEAATTELQNAAFDYAAEAGKDVQCSGFTPFMNASNRLLNAAIAFANTVNEYRER